MTHGHSGLLDARVRRFTAHAGLLISVSALFGCTESSSSAPPAAPAIFENPPELSPDAEGVRELHFRPAEVTIEGKRYCLRTYNGSIPGPTIRIPAGADRRVRVNLYNEFKRSDYHLIAGMEGHAEAHCHDFNLTNLHAHGTHVQPNYASPDPADPCQGEGCGADSRYFGDHVLHEVPSGEMAQYRWDLDEDGTHEAGLDWYHPHIHGSTAIQVTNGAAGALIIEGDIDKVPGVAKAKERVMVLTQIPFDSEYTTPLKDGEACTEDTLSVNNFLSVSKLKPTMINGKLEPHILTAPNQVERLRVIYAGFPDEMGIKLHIGKDERCSSFDLEPIELTQIARDGLTLPQFYKSDTMWVSPGYRIEALVKMPAEKKTLCLVARRVADPLGTVIGIFDVDPSAGAPTEVNMPAESDIAKVARPTTWTGKVDGQMTQVSCDSVKTVHQKVVLLVPSPGDPPDKMLQDPSDLGSCDPSQYMHGIDPSAPVCVCPAPNISCRRFDERRMWGYRSDRVMEADTTEKWEIRAFDGHPFHIHVNPFLVCPTNSNKEPNFPHWRDTYWVQAEDGPREVLMNPRKFAGQFVLHCHKLNHEDDGMMELVEICPPGDTKCLCQGTDANGQCISQAGCKADDKQCQFAKEATDAYPLPPAPDPALCGP